MTIARLASPLFVVVALGLVGCGNRSSGYTPKPAEEVKPVDLASVDKANVFPLKEGNSWTFESQVAITLPNGQSQTNTEDITLRVERIATDGGETRAEIHVIREADLDPETGQLTEAASQQKADRSGWMVNSEGIYQTAGSRDLLNYSPALPSLLFALKQGEEQEFVTTGPLPAGSADNNTIPVRRMIVRHTALGPQQVDTERGTLPAFSTQTILLYPAQGDDVEALSAALAKLREAGVTDVTSAASGTPTEPAAGSGEAEGTEGTTGTEGSTGEATSTESSSTDSASTEAPSGDSATALSSSLPTVPPFVASTSTVFWSPGVGMVRFRQVVVQPSGIRIVQTLRLKDYDLKS